MKPDSVDQEYIAKRPLVPSGTYTIYTEQTEKSNDTERMRPFEENDRNSYSTIATHGTKRFEQIDKTNEKFMAAHGSKVIGPIPLDGRTAAKVNEKANKEGADIIKNKYKKDELQIEINLVRAKMKKLGVAIAIVGTIAIVLLAVGASLMSN